MPRYRQGEEECVQPRIVESLPNVASGREKNPSAGVGIPGEFLQSRLRRPSSESAAQQDHLWNGQTQRFSQPFQVFGAFGEYQRGAPPSRPINFGVSSRNEERRSIHCCKSWRRWLRNRVFVCRAAISYAATTVFPKAVVAASTPVSCANSALPTAPCSGRSSLRNWVIRTIPRTLSSRNSVLILSVLRRWFSSSRQPRGRPR
ncbi:MAG: hypothetical protein RIS76_4719 [Verrucomicrobiota bacterium]